MIFTHEEWERFYKLRQKIFELIREEDDGYHKSYEGAMDVTISFPSIYEADNERSFNYVSIALHCYLLINGRHEEWVGHTFTEALDKIESWIKATEMCMQEQQK